MPLYEYECTLCKRHTEKIQKFSDTEITECPHCGGLLERVISAPAISFKGGGWFADGYGSARSSSNGDSGESNSPSSDTSTAPAATPAASPAAAPAPAASTASPSSEKK